MNAKKLKKLKELIYEVSDIKAAGAVLSWDQETYMPKGGIQERAEQLSTLNKIAHEKFTSPKIGELIKELKNEIKSLNDESDDVRLIKVLNRTYNKAIKVPSSLVAEISKACSIGQQTWAEAKSRSDFNLFKPCLERLVELKKEYAKLFSPYNSIYDPLLDDFEPGLKTSDVKKIFSELRPQQVKFIQQIKRKKEIDNSFLFREYNVKKQLAFGENVITKFGFDWDRGRQDKSAHPFTISFGMNDVRITTRFDKQYLPMALFGTLHEAGHAMYEQNISQKLRRTSIGTGASWAIHESQSRLWENIIGRSKAFWKCFYPELQKIFSKSLSDISLNKFYKGINKVKPSLIRIESDEATYNLHIMLRLEIEIALMEDKINVADLPDMWNSKMNEYLGITPENDKEGVLQDIHWSMGSIGYFSTYALGNLISVQVWQKINQDIPDISSQIEQGEFSTLLNWLKNNIYIHGAKFEPQELVQKVTGSKINPAPYIQYLKQKYSEIYS